MRRLVSVVLVLVCALFALQAEAAGLVDNGDGTVTDNKTGLMWQKQDDGIGYSWYQASGKYDAECNSTSQNVCGSLKLGGKSDWRLPSNRELKTILTYFWNIRQTDSWSSNFWSSTNPVHPSVAWYASFADGIIYANGFKSYTFYVRCVRGGL